MTENRSLSSSEQYIKKSNRKLLIIGLILLVAFFVALMLVSNKKTVVQQKAPVDFRTDDFAEAAGVKKDASLLPFGGGAKLVPEPAEVAMNNVVLGSKAESIIVLTAQNSPILFLGMELAEAQQDGFTLETTCTPNMKLEANASCNIKVLWNPVALRQIQNILYVRYREDSTSSYREERLSINLKAQSTDSKDCVICENVGAATEKKPVIAMAFDGKLYEVDKDSFITIDGKKHKITENGLIMDEKGTLLGIVQPTLLPLGMDSKVLGKVSDTQDVIASNGDKVGRLLGDGTIVTPELKVVGAAVPVVSVMNEQGQIVGKLVEDGTVVDGTNAVIGRPLVDGRVEDLQGNTMGYLRPWGLVINFTGNVIGGILPDGNVTNTANQNIAKITPTGVAVDATGELIGGVVPKGVGVGAACNALGTVALNGEVRDAYDQVIGKALMDGAVVDDAQNEVGSVISQGLVINEKGTLLGFVNSAGKAVDAKGSVIGCINPDGSISAGKKLIGAVMAKGSVITNGCQVMGTVYPDGTVLNSAAENVGKVLADRYVTNTNNRIIGVVVPRGTGIGEGCRLLGLISMTGRVMDTSGADVGCVTPENTVVNAQNTVIGSVAPRGIVVDSSGKVIGRIRYDGKVIDAEGKVIGCVNPDGSVTDLNGKPLGTLVGGEALNGVILDDNGNSTGWTAVGAKVFDGTGNELGTVLSNMQVIDMNGALIGFIPSNGVVFSPDGLVLGRYSQKTGVAVNLAGERFARVLPDGTVISGDKGDIVGALIADKTNFMDLNGAFVGTMQIDGTLNSGNTPLGAIRADGSVVDKTGKIVALKIPTGNVYSSAGTLVGTVSSKGEVVSAAKTVIGRVLGNGLALGSDNTILGGVFNEIALPISTDGILGAIMPNGAVNDKNGRKIGSVSPFGLVLGLNGELLGNLLRVGPFVDATGATVGWVSFKGDINGKDGRAMGRALSNGTALDRNNMIAGALSPRGAAVNTIGTFIGTTQPNARVLGGDGTTLGSFKASPYFYNVAQRVAGQYLKPGVGLDTNGNLLGWTRFDGVIEGTNGPIGLVSLDGRIFAQNGAVLGFYVPLGMPAINDSGKSFGFMGANGFIINSRGEQVGKAISGENVVQNGKLIGRLMGNTDFVNDDMTGALIGQAGVNGTVTQIGDTKPLGSVLMNGFVLNLTNQVVGGLSVVGIPLSNTLSVLGQSFLDGEIISEGRLLGKTLANAVIYDTTNNIVGGVLKPNAFIGRDGMIIGATEGGADVLSVDGSPLARQMPFGSALTQENIWAGGSLQNGVVINDDGFEIGVTAADGTVLGASDAVMARLLPDGSAAGVMDRNTYATMPYAGRLAKQGLPVHYKGQVLGHTTATGEVIDASGKKATRVLDDGTLLGSDMPLSGMVIALTPALDHNGDTLGMISGDGSVLNAAGTIQGTLASNGTVKGNNALKILGAVIPDGLVTNGCKVIGQTTYDGQIVNGRGDIIGRVQIDKSATNKSGEKVGRVVRNGSVLSTNGDFLGRTLADSSVVDTTGANIGCATTIGEVIDTAGTKMGCVLERGPIITSTGEMIARSKFDGTLVNGASTVVGKIDGDCKTARDLNGNVIGRMVSPDEELIFNPDGSIAGTFGRDGTYYNPKGDAIFKIMPNGDVLNPKTNQLIGKLGEDGIMRSTSGETLDGITLLRDLEGNVLGIVSGCSVLNSDGQKIATIMADGSIMDLNGDLFATVLGDGTLLDKNGAVMGAVVGSNTRLDKCGIKSVKGEGSGSASGRRIFIGKNIYGITSGGSIVDKDGTVLGYMGEDGRPYSMENRLLTGADASGRTRPNLNKTIPVNTDQLDQMQQLLAQKRSGMRGGIKNVIKPDGRILARSKAQQDEDWGLPRIVSSWPVKMDRMILKDKAIPAVLVRSIDSRYKDVPATAIVERHIYSEEGRNILIPAGSRLIGKISGSPGQNHVAKMELKWERLIRPDGGAFKFSASSGDAQGRGGVAAYLDEQLLAKYGKPVLSSSVTSAITYMAADGSNVTTTENGTQTQSDRSKAAEDARQTFTDNMDQIFQQLIDDSTKIPPVVFVPAGTRLTVFSNEDLWLRSEKEDVRAYEEAMGKASLDAQKAKTSSWVDKRQNPNDQLIANKEAGTEADAGYYSPEDGYDESADAGYTDTASDQPLYDGETEEVVDQADQAPQPPAQTPKQPVQSGADLKDRVSKPILPKSNASAKMF